MVFARRDLPDGVDRGRLPGAGQEDARRGGRQVGVPRRAGRPADARHRRQGRRVPARRERGVPARPAADGRERRRSLAHTLGDAGARLVSGGTDNHLALVDVTPLGVTGREAERLLDDVGHHREQERDPVRREPAQRRVRDPDRDAGDDDPRHGARRDAAIGRWIVDSDPGTRRRRPRSRPDSAEVRELVARFPVPGLPARQRRRGARAPMEDRRVVRRSRSRRVLPLVVVAFVAAAVALAPADAAGARRRRSGSTTIDRPEQRRVNLRPIPRGGGVAVAVAFLAGATGRRSRRQRRPGARPRAALDPAARARRAARWGRARPPCSASSTTPSSCVRAGSSLGQLALAALAVAAGITVGFVNNPFGPGNILLGGPFAVAFTVLWIVGHDQQHQLHRRPGRAVVRDRADRGRDPGPDLARRRPSRSRSSAVLCFALAGALLGFLRWNFHPASIFIGTSGVMFVGYTLAVLSILGHGQDGRRAARARACRSSTRSGSSSGAWRPDARRSRPTVATSTTGCSTSACRTARRCSSSTRSASASPCCSFVLSGTGQVYAFLGPRGGVRAGPVPAHPRGDGRRARAARRTRQPAPPDPLRPCGLRGWAPPMRLWYSLRAVIGPR